jgi:hypothetical protein
MAFIALAARAAARRRDYEAAPHADAIRLRGNARERAGCEYHALRRQVVGEG